MDEDDDSTLGPDPREGAAPEPAEGDAEMTMEPDLLDDLPGEGTEPPPPPPEPVPGAPPTSGGLAQPGEIGRATGDLITRLPDGRPLYRQESKIFRRRGDIHVDGRGADAGWAAIPWTRGDFQLKPNLGGPPTGGTYFKVAYDDHDVYAIVRVEDPQGHLQTALRHRNDDSSRMESSEWIALWFDPTLNRRSGYAFQVNAAGVKNDWRMINDSDFDITYDAVWDAKTEMTDHGFTCEWRIPLSQMRTTTAPAKWGFNVHRRIARSQEVQTWSPFTYDAGRGVSASGYLNFEDTLRPRRNIELRPYALIGADVLEDAPTALRETIDPITSVGLDVTARAGSFSLTSVFNPDFGQVEADPSVVNLTNREIFFEERRPFFQKDNEIFTYPLDGFETLFYSRRIGAPPHGTLDGDAVEQRKSARILGAAKVTGDWGASTDVGLMTALTAEESGDALADGSVTTAVVEPLSSYNALSIGRRLGDGSTEVRGFATATARRLADTGLEDELHRSALTGGLKLLHRAASGSWKVEASADASNVRGSKAALIATQEASQRYFQRPDADHLELDRDRTSLSGVSARVAAQTIGTHAISGSLRAVSPGFETNDLGFLLQSDLLVAAVGHVYESYRSSGPLISLRNAVAPKLVLDTAGTPMSIQLNDDGSFQTSGFRGLSWSAGVQHGLLDTALLRGGPAVGGVDTFTLGFQVNTAPAGRVSGWLGAIGSATPEAGGRTLDLEVGAVLQLSPSLFLTLVPSFKVNVDGQQYVDLGGPIEVDGADNYLIARLEQDTAAAQLRGSWRPREDLSLDMYLQPFVTTGAYGGYKVVDDARAGAFADRYREIDVRRRMGQLDLDFDRDGTADAQIGEQNFRITEMIANVVARWEYRLGSTIFLVWSHRNSTDAPELDPLPGSFRTLTKGQKEDVFLLKASYWWNPSF